MSIQDIQQNPQDTTNFYLANIHQAMINPDGFNFSTPPSAPPSPPPFSPPNHAIWVNALWFLSLAQPYVCTPCNVATAMGATISQDHSVAIQSTQTSAHPCVLCRRRREVSPTMDRRCLAHASPHFPLPVLCRPCCIVTIMDADAIGIELTGK